MIDTHLIEVQEKKKKLFSSPKLMRKIYDKRKVDYKKIIINKLYKINGLLLYNNAFILFFIFLNYNFNFNLTYKYLGNCYILCSFRYSLCST